MNNSIARKDQDPARSLADGRTFGKAPPIAGAPHAEADWHAGSGIIDQMVAYRDWWNLPVRRPLGQNRAAR